MSDPVFTYQTRLELDAAQATVSGGDFIAITASGQAYVLKLK